MTENEKRRTKVVNCDDLGSAAYLSMHGHKVCGREGKTIYFEIGVDEEDEFNSNMLEYVNSVFHDFDSHLMALKKLKSGYIIHPKNW